MKRVIGCASIGMLLISLQSTAAFAQGTARSMDIDVSIRSAGMGGASNAVLWGRGLNHWANPALLGAERGIRWEWGRTQLVPDLASDVIFESQVLKLAGGGAGIVSSGTPLGRGVHLSYGESEGTDESGNPTGTFVSFEQIDSWGFGVSAFEAIETLAQLRENNEPGPFSRHVDVAFGMNFKDVEMNLFPGVSAGTTARDWGVSARLTPVDLRTDGGTWVHLDATIGVSVLNANNDAVVDFGFESDPVTRHRRAGMGLHLAIDPRTGRISDPDGGSWLEVGMSPLLSVGIAADRSKIGAPIGQPSQGPPGNGQNQYETEGVGLEVALANILWGRAGHYTDREGDIDDATWGWGIQLPLGRIAGIRYDGALFPQAKGLDSIKRHGASVWLDPFALARALKERRGISI